MNIKQAISRLKTHKNCHCTGLFVKGATIFTALDMAITALEEQAERAEKVKKHGAEIAPHTYRTAIIYEGVRKGKYGIEYVASISYTIEQDIPYNYRAMINTYPHKIAFVVGSNPKRLRKKVLKQIKRFDNYVIQCENELDSHW